MFRCKLMLSAVQFRLRDHFTAPWKKLKPFHWQKIVSPFIELSVTFRLRLLRRCLFLITFIWIACRQHQLHLCWLGQVPRESEIQVIKEKSKELSTFRWMLIVPYQTWSEETTLQSCVFQLVQRLIDAHQIIIIKVPQTFRPSSIAIIGYMQHHVEKSLNYTFCRSWIMHLYLFKVSYHSSVIVVWQLILFC